MLKPKRKALLDSLVEEGVTIQDMHKKHGFNYKTVRKYYPDYRAGDRRWVNGRNQNKIRLAEKTIQIMAEERAPGSAIAEVIGVNKQALKRQCPNLFWTPKETAEFARMVQEMNNLPGGSN